MKFSKEKVKEQKSENIIVAISMIAIVILVFILFGWSGIKSWLATPLIWKGQDSLDVQYLGTVPKEQSTEDYIICLSLTNNTNEKIDYYDITFEIEGVEFEYQSDSYHYGSSYYADNSISAHGISLAKFEITTEKFFISDATEVTEDVMNKLINNEQTDSVDVSYKIKSLKSNDKTIVNNSGVFKDIIIVILSFALGAFGFFGNINKAWLRVILKLFALPAMIIILGIVLVFAIAAYSASPEGQAAAEANRQKFEQEQKAKAAREYESAAHAKAASIARGDYKSAAYAQERMDKSKVDMISASSSHKAAYKSAAHAKAASIARGDHKSAAYAQEKMDKEMADILSDK